MMKREKLFAGFNKEEGKMAWIEVEIRTYEGVRTFTLCGTECYVAKWGQVEKEEHIESVIDCMGSDWILDRLKEHDCTWSDLPENLVSEFEQNESFGEHYYDVDTLHDTEGNTYQCDVSGCGQCDIRTHVEPLNAHITRLLEIWDKYHLKGISEEMEQEVKDIIEAYEVEIEKLADDKYDGTYIADAIFKELCESYYGVEGLY